jgi:Alcohol dehydrogenase GroES-like domain
MGRGILLWLFGVPIPIIICWRLSGTEEAIMALTTQTTNPAALVTDSPLGCIVGSRHSWGVAAVALTLLLVALGTGIGLSSVSPWSSSNPSATTFTLLAAVWLIIVQWLSSGLGGYLAYVPGMEAAGIVDEVGSGVPDRLKVGDAVMAIVVPKGSHGAYREQIVLDARSVVRAPTGKTHPEACSLPMNGLTARQSLDLLKLSPSQVSQ